MVFFYEKYENKQDEKVQGYQQKISPTYKTFVHRGIKYGRKIV
jgi:hypothetical protein